MAEVADHQGPQREGLFPGFGALQRLLDHEHLVQAEEDPRQVGDEKDEDDSHEDDRQVVLLTPAAAVVLHDAVGRQREGALPQHAGRRIGLVSGRPLAAAQPAQDPAAAARLAARVAAVAGANVDAGSLDDNGRTLAAGRRWRRPWRTSPASTELK